MSMLFYARRDEGEIHAVFEDNFSIKDYHCESYPNREVVSKCEQFREIRGETRPLYYVAKDGDHYNVVMLEEVGLGRIVESVVLQHADLHGAESLCTWRREA